MTDEEIPNPITDQHINDYRQRILNGEDLPLPLLRAIVRSRTHAAQEAHLAQSQSRSRPRKEKAKPLPGALDALLSQDLGDPE